MTLFPDIVSKHCVKTVFKIVFQDIVSRQYYNPVFQGNIAKQRKKDFQEHFQDIFSRTFLKTVFKDSVSRHRPKIQVQYGVSIQYRKTVCIK